MIVRVMGTRSLATSAVCCKVRIGEIRIFDEFLVYNKRKGR